MSADSLLVMLKNPKKGTEFRRVGDRLALFHSAENPDRYWHEYWKGFNFDSLHTSPGLSALGELANIFTRYLARDEIVLEAGCGAGRIMAALVAEGFEVLGVERSAEVVAVVNEKAPFLSVREGDVEDLDLEDQSVGSYVSLGVLEHLESGPERALQEAARVLQPGGVALVSVPYLNPLRSLHLGRLTRGSQSGLRFHQYYFSRLELDGVLQDSGFTVSDHLPYAVEGCLVREHALFSRFWTSSICREKLKRPLRSWFSRAPDTIRWRYGHMLLAVGFRD